GLGAGLVEHRPTPATAQTETDRLRHLPFYKGSGTERVEVIPHRGVVYRVARRRLNSPTGAFLNDVADAAEQLVRLTVAIPKLTVSGQAQIPRIAAFEE